MERRTLMVLLCSDIVFHFMYAEQQFFLVKEPLSWAEAQTYCRGRYTDLVTVYNDQENQELVALGQNMDECVWIGLQHKADTWRWTMGDPSIYIDSDNGIWGDDEPDNSGGNQHCVRMSASYGGAADRGCSNEHYFICSDGVNQHTLIKWTETWSDARAYCRTYYNDLATISIAEAAPLRQEIDDAGRTSAWIGLFRDAWSVWSDNNYTEFSNWETQPSFYPDDDHCGCLSTSTGKWIEEVCTFRKPFFCYGDVKDTALKVKLQSEIDLSNKAIQLQIVEQMQNRLASMGVANLTVMWQATTKMTSNEAAPNEKCPESD